MITLRDYQQKAIADMQAAFAGGARRVLFVLPTGGGKTVVASRMIAGSIARNRQALMLAHRVELIDQISGALELADIDHGRIQRGKAGNGHLAQVGMIGTVARRLDRMKPPSLIVVDEAHHATAGQYRLIIDAFPDARVVGLTATPARTDGKGLGDVFDAMVLGPSMRDLIGMGNLSEYQYFAPDMAADMRGVPKRGGDYVASATADRFNTPTITGDAISTYDARGERGQFIAFCASVKHAADVAAQFTMSGFPCRPLDGSMAASERNDAINGFRSGQLLGLASCDLISEGFDVPGASVAIMLRPTQSLIIHMQQAGRVLRPSPGKVAVILDHAGNLMRHGLPDMPRDWTLEGCKPAKMAHSREFAIRRCKICFAVYPATTPQCPACHAIAATKSRKIEFRDGELVEITAQMERAERWREGSQAERLAECRTVDDLMAMATARGYKKGWALSRAMDHLGMPFNQAADALGYSRIFKMKSRRNRS